MIYIYILIFVVLWLSVGDSVYGELSATSVFLPNSFTSVVIICRMRFSWYFS